MDDLVDTAYEQALCPGNLLILERIGTKKLKWLSDAVRIFPLMKVVDGEMVREKRKNDADQENAANPRRKRGESPQMMS